MWIRHSSHISFRQQHWFFNLIINAFSLNLQNCNSSSSDFFWKIFWICIFVVTFQLFNTNSIQIRIKFIANYFIFEFFLTWWSFSYSRIACSMHTQANINVVSNNESNRFWMCFNWINFKFISFQKININVCVITCA